MDSQSSKTQGGAAVPNLLLADAELSLPYTAFREKPKSPKRRGYPRLCNYNIEDIMAVVVEMQNTGDSRARAEIALVIEHVLSDRPGDWRVSIVGSRENDNWELKIEGPKGFERSYTLIGGAGQHQPDAIRHLLLKLLPSSV